MSGSAPRLKGGKYATQKDIQKYMRTLEKPIHQYQSASLNKSNNFQNSDNMLFNQPSDTNHTLYAENNFDSTATDASYTSNPNYISDEDLYKRMQNNIAKYEKFTEHPYLDSKGYITTGYGSNIHNKDDFMKTPFTIQGRAATDDEKNEYYHNLDNMSALVDQNYNYVHHNKEAKNFENETPLRISQEDALNMAHIHMTNDLAQVRREFPNFDSFPLPLKEVLLDIQYNVKGGLQKKNWPHLYDAIKRKDVLGEDGIAANVHRKDVHKERNDWADQMARSIRF